MTAPKPVRQREHGQTLYQRKENNGVQRKLTSMAAPAIVLGGLFIASVAFAQQNLAPSAPMGSGSMQGSGMMQGGTMSGSGGTQPKMQDCQKMMSGGPMSGMGGDMKAMMDRCNETMKQGGRAGAPMQGNKN